MIIGSKFKRRSWSWTLSNYYFNVLLAGRTEKNHNTSQGAGIAQSV